MKHLRKFENFEEEDMFAKPAEDFKVFTSEEEEEEDGCEACNDEEGSEEDEDLEGEEEVKDWNDAQTLERVKSFESFITEGKKKAKPDFLDIDKDGDKKEPMKKAAKEAKGKKEDKKDSKKDSKKEDDVMLTAKQKKLPPALRERIAKSQSKK
jgi:hypothetical protein